MGMLLGMDLGVLLHAQFFYLLPGVPANDEKCKKTGESEIKDGIAKNILNGHKCAEGCYE